jgi:hypothetical protein
VLAENADKFSFSPFAAAVTIVFWLYFCGDDRRNIFYYFTATALN